MRMEVEMGMIYMGVWILVFLHDLFNLHIPDDQYNNTIDTYPDIRKILVRIEVLMVMPRENPPETRQWSTTK